MPAHPTRTKSGIYRIKTPSVTNRIITNKPAGIIALHNKSKKNRPNRVVLLPAKDMRIYSRREATPRSMHNVMTIILCIGAVWVRR